MRWLKVLACFVVVNSVLSVQLSSQERYSQGQDLANVTIYEGARLIIGDATPPIEHGAFVVQQGKIVAVGEQGTLKVPPGTKHMDLTGKTVIPALVNIHAHLGWEVFSANGDIPAAPGNFTEANLLDHLEREAFYGVGTVLDGGSSRIDVAQQFQADDMAWDFPQDHAQVVLMAGVVPPHGGPDNVLIKGTEPDRANYYVLRAPEARAAVDMIAVQGINAAQEYKQLKIWWTDRNGSYTMLPDTVFEAIIDEAHNHGIKVHVHATNLVEQKAALRAGVDLVVHTIQNAKLDDELITLIREKKPYWTPVMGLGDHSEACDHDRFVDQTMSAKVTEQMRGSARCKPNANAATREAILKNNFMAYINAGARIVLGTDAGVSPTYSFGSADQHEIRRYVQLGLSPADAIIASTSRPAEALGRKDIGMLAVGRWADFDVLDANPLEDISNTRQINSVYLHGKKLDRQALIGKLKSPSAPKQVSSLESGLPK